MSDSPSPRFLVGDTIILNDLDRPEGRLVAVVEAVQPMAPERGQLAGRWLYTFSYLCREERLNQYQRMVGTLPDATKLSDFGCVIEFKDDMYMVRQTAESKATYCNGQQRLWQEPLPGWRQFRPELAKLTPEYREQVSAAGGSIFGLVGK